MEQAQILTAEHLGEKIKEISIAEFFEKNRHLLGYENPTKSLLTVVKEAVENSLDACEEARILPEIEVKIKQIGENKYRVSVKDNGPGIVSSKVPYAFGKFLVGSKFYRLRQSRGIQGIGIHGAVLYAQLTTGKPAKITVSTGKGKIHYFELMIDVIKNEPKILKHEQMENKNSWHGVKIELEVEGRYAEGGRQSILNYLKQTALVNPFAKITFVDPKGNKHIFKRVVNKLPKVPTEIKPHPYGVEIGVLSRMLSLTKAKTMLSFLTTEFSRVGRNTATKICKLAKISPRENPHNLKHEQIEKLHKAMQMVKVAAPPTNCLSPVGEDVLIAGLKKEYKAEFYTAITRPPSVYRGYPFQVEVALAYGGELPQDRSSVLLRFANKIPLLYHQSSCVITEAVKEVNWRNYGLSQPSNSFPIAPLIIVVHFISVWVPFTSEGKQAIASYPEILKEIKLALQDAGRKLAKYVRRKRKLREKQMRRQLFERYIPEVSKALSKLIKKNEKEIYEKLERLIKKKLEAVENEKTES